MSTATEIAALKAELVETKVELSELKRALDSFFSSLDRDSDIRRFDVLWRNARKLAKVGTIERADDAVTAGRGLPAAPTRIVKNGIGADPRL
jgi:hypothetical protein